MRVVARAAVAVGDVEVAVRAEGERAAVVVPERLLVRGGVPPPSPGRPRRVVLADAGTARRRSSASRLDVGVEDEELAVLLELGMEREAEETFLVLVVVVADAVVDVEEDFVSVAF